ncbi:hypothetical protein IEQ34_002366 [Dendrobium chrysotoxum]|uniref:Uncharacterized protein n=1 Tax=Dendrobium chrysotoxum TaxID=161865 RepID=A0AAV7HLM6_DENCH|nr:hypothetical protein IEQ34_002366 [Dendrobium chrysotoxum]
MIAITKNRKLENYWNTRITRRQRAGLPLYPPDIQRNIEHPSTQLYHNYIDHQKLPPQLKPPLMQLTTNYTTMAEPVPLLMPPPPLSLLSNTKHLSMDPFWRLGDSDISIGMTEDDLRLNLQQFNPNFSIG